MNAFGLRVLHELVIGLITKGREINDGMRVGRLDPKERTLGQGHELFFGLQDRQGAVIALNVQLGVTLGGHGSIRYTAGMSVYDVGLVRS